MVAREEGGGGTVVECPGSSIHSFHARPSDPLLLSDSALMGLDSIGPDHWLGVGTPPVQEFVQHASSSYICSYRCHQVDDTVSLFSALANYQLYECVDI